MLLVQDTSFIQNCNKLVWHVHFASILVLFTYKLLYHKSHVSVLGLYVCYDDYYAI